MTNKIPSTTLDRAQELVANGWSYRQTATALHVNADVLSAHLRARGTVSQFRRGTIMEKVDEAAMLYTQGMSVTAIAEKLTIRTPDLLSKYLKKRGITIRRKHGQPAPNRRQDIPETEIVKAYRAGESELALSLRFRCSRGTITKILGRHGVERRTGSQASVRRMQSMTPQARRELLSAARAVRIANMQTAAINGSYHPAIGPGENLIARGLRKRGWQVAQQVEIGPYCIDILVGSLAVEVRHKSKGQLTARSNIKRSEHLVERGLSLVFVFFLGDETTIVESTTDDVICCLDILCRNPPPPSEYRVITCRFENDPVFKLNRNKTAFVPVAPQPLTTVAQRHFS